MPVFFQYVGQLQADTAHGGQAARILGTYDHAGAAPPIKAQAAPSSWEMRVDDFLPMITRIGTPARKIFAADGTRYVDASTLLDYDPTPVPQYFGSFTSSGAWWAGDT
ncbi:MAG TPA: hypothetical protein VMC02_11520, partial [Steroidobacteraceae bacterium]|nr:hypothetical protein [Steroidobacteraceae bacterium]